MPEQATRRPAEHLGEPVVDCREGGADAELRSARGCQPSGLQDEIAGWVALQYFCNAIAPLMLFLKKPRTSPVVLYVVSVLVLIGMWFEPFNIIVPSLSHDFYPYTWGSSFRPLWTR